MDKVENKIKEILADPINECTWLDYKVKWYKNKAELLKDIVAMLNSDEAYGKDKFLIIGVNDQKQLVGLQQNDIPDDNEIQSLLKKINPIPTVSSGTVIYNGKTFGFLLISKDNYERIYEINDNVYDASYVNRNSDKMDERKFESCVRNIINKGKFKGQSFIRTGSTNNLITDEQRKHIYFQSKEYQEKQKRKDLIVKMDADVLKIGVLIHSWDEKYEGDKKVIEEFINTDYSTFIEKIRSEKMKYPDIIKYNNSIWEIALDDNLTEKIIVGYDDLFFEKYFNKAIYLSNIFNENLTDDWLIYNCFEKDHLAFSNILRSYILNNIARISVLKKGSNNIYNYGMKFLENIFSKNDWKYYMSLVDVIKCLGEINPQLYLLEYSKKFNQKENSLLNMMKETPKYNYYNTQLNECFMVSLKTLALFENYFIESVKLMFMLCINNKENLEYLIDVFSIERPQTSATLTYRVMMIENFFKTNSDFAWYFLIRLFQNIGRGNGMINYPEYMDKPCIVYKTNSKENISKYVNCLLKHMDKNANRIKDLINIFQFLLNDDFEKLTNEIRKNIASLENEDKDEIIHSFNKYLVEQKHFGNLRYGFTTEKMTILEKMIDDFGQDKTNLERKLLFRNEQYLLCDDYFDKSELIFAKQIEVVEKIYKESGITAIIQFSTEIENKNELGHCLVRILNNTQDILEIINLLNDKELKDVTFGYICNLKEDDIDQFISVYKLINDDLLKAKVLSIGKNTAYTIKLLDDLSESSRNYFWENVETRFIDINMNIVEFEKCFDNLLRVNQYEKAFTCLTIRKKFAHSISCDMICKLLNALMEANREVAIKQFEIQKLIKYLQDHQYDEVVLLKFEWKWLTSYDNYYKPITIIKNISRKPNNFSRIIDMYNANDEDQDMKTKIYYTLIAWYTSPLYSLEIIDGIDQWYIKMKENIQIEKSFVSADRYFGKSLASINEIDGAFLLNDAMCKILEEDDNYSVREGYKFVKMFGNEFEGRHFMSAEDKYKLSEEYKKWSELAAERGLLNITQMFLDISESLLND